jgi:hypothetical protein
MNKGRVFAVIVIILTLILLAAYFTNVSAARPFRGPIKWIEPAQVQTVNIDYEQPVRLIVPEERKFTFGATATPYPYP